MEQSVSEWAAEVSATIRFGAHRSPSYPTARSLLMAARALRPDLQATTTSVASLAGFGKQYLAKKAASSNWKAWSSSGALMRDVVSLLFFCRNVEEDIDLLGTT